MRITFICSFLITLICLNIESYAQPVLDDIKLEQIRQKTVRKYIKCQIKEGKHQFNDIQASWHNGQNLSFYNRNEMTFFLNGNLQDIWQSHLLVNPSKLWNNRRSSLGLMLQKFPANIFYNRDSLANTDTGQVYFLNLKLLSGIFNLPVAFEIISIDAREKIIEFSYIKGNQSLGVQQIKFIALDDKHTKILHISYFKSKSNFRDKYLYPFFHKKFIKDFHRNMKKLLTVEHQVGVKLEILNKY
ncbi:MAG: hypothetical protein SGJ00_06310 [bacterium]|nr:hypothetical protein [bacterium]